METSEKQTLLGIHLASNVQPERERQGEEGEGDEYEVGGGSPPEEKSCENSCGHGQVVRVDAIPTQHILQPHKHCRHQHIL